MESEEIVGTPWLVSITICYIGFSLIGLIFYEIPPFIGLLPLLPLALLLLYLEGPSARRNRNELVRASWLVVLWTYVLVYYGGGGVSIYLPSIVRDWALLILILVGSLALVRVTSNSDSGFLSRIGLRRGLLKNSVGIVVVAGTMYIFIFIGAMLPVVSSHLAPESWVHFLFTSTFLPAFVEEITYRGIVQEGLSSRYQNRTTGLLLSSLVFGFGHTWTNQGEYQDILLGIVLCFVIQFIGGVILGGIYEITDSVASGILVHYMYNAQIWLVDLVPELSPFRIVGMIAAMVLVFSIITGARVKGTVKRLYDFIVSIASCFMKCILERLRLHQSSR